MEVIARFGDVLDRLGLERLALLHGEDAGDGFDPVLPDLVGAETEFGPFEGRPVPHLFGGGAGRGDRSIDVVGRGQGDCGEMLPGARRAQFVVAVATALRPFPGYEEFQIGAQKVLLSVAPRRYQPSIPG